MKYEINEYVVTFNSNGGSAVDGQIVKYNTKVGKPDNPIKTGHEFLKENEHILKLSDLTRKDV